MTSPITPNRDDLAAYLNFIFEYVADDDTCVALRGTGEKGTAGEGAFIEPIIVPAIVSQFDVDRIFGHVQRWSAHGRASFIVPAAIDAAALSDRHATEDRIRLLTTIVVDIDKGDTAAALAHAVKYMGQPSMLVHSGGTTETGAPKLHAYWRLSEGSDRIADIAAARKVLALKVGGDPSFGRSTQVIRLPGSIYSKHGVTRPCAIVDRTSYEYELTDLLAAIADMPLAPGVVIDEAKIQPTLPMPAEIYSAKGGGLNFSGFKSAGGDVRHERQEIGPSLITPIAEGGQDDRNRWSEFNRVAGHYIHTARRGDTTLDEAKDLARGWMAANMQPPWPPVRFESEWKALIAHDVKAKGPMPSASALIEATQNGVGIYAQQPTLHQWAVSDWTASEKPKRRFLIEGLVMAGKAHMLAAEGGAGKTFLLLDLALKIALHKPGMASRWCGMGLDDDAGGTAVMFTTEDDKEELHIRLADIDPEGRRKMAGNRLVIIPTINIGGAFALVERDRATGNAKLSGAWSAWLNQLREVKDLRLVVIDTLNTTLHGEENNATVINEYVQAAAAVVCGELGAALIVTHHVRKPGENTKIYTPEQMKNSIRGSTALIGAFRATLGIWHAPDYKERLAKMGEEAKPGRLFNFAVVKANNPEMYWEVRTMLRQRSGILLDITDDEKRLAAATIGQAEAWFIHAIAYAAEKGHPFTIKAAKMRKAPGRRTQLPELLQNMTERDMDSLANRLVADGRLKQCNPRASGIAYNYLDVPDGPLAKGVGLDGGAYERMTGADFEPPSWGHLWAYHQVEQRIVRRGQELARVVGVRAPQHDPITPAMGGNFNPNRPDAS